MNTRTILVLTMVVLLFGSASTNSANTASFQGLGSFPSSHFNSDAFDVSADGSVVVGRSLRGWYDEAFRWENGVMTGLGLLHGPSFGSQATDVSADGSVVAGSCGGVERGAEAFRWENGVMTGLGDLPGGYFYSHTLDVSADGSVVVGESRSASGFEAFRWKNGVMTGLSDLPGGTFKSYAFYVSADGSVVVGNSESALGREAFFRPLQPRVRRFSRWLGCGRREQVCLRLGGLPLGKRRNDRPGRPARRKIL
jgi:probable HAF family extracellular repeat protein